MACDHPGSARYTQVNGQIIKPGGPRSERAQMEADRPKDVMFLLDAMTKLASGQDWVWMCHSLWVWAYAYSTQKLERISPPPKSSHKIGTKWHEIASQTSSQKTKVSKYILRYFSYGNAVSQFKSESRKVHCTGAVSGSNMPNNTSWHFQDSRFAGRVNVNLTALTGMSFGGFTTATCLEESDSRVKAAIMMCLL